MILLTGATGTVGSALLRRLVASGETVRCLVRDPKRLGGERVRVQLALGDLGDPASFRNALRGVDTVIHLAASIRDQPRGSIEELSAVATLRLVRAAERGGASRFLFFSALGASPASRTRFMRSKSLAREAVERSSLETHDLRALDRLRPQRPLGDPAQPDGAAAAGPDRRPRPRAVPAHLGRGRRRLRGRGAWPRTAARPAATSWSGPDTLSYDDIVRTALGPRPLLHVPMPVGAGGAAGRGADLRARPRSPPREEVELLEEPMTSARGTADAEALGVRPRAMSAVFGAA